MNTVMIVAGESSGELYGSLLAKALKSRLPNIHLIGIGGKRMHEVGVELISSISDAFGIVEAISAYRRVKSTFDRAVDALKKFMPDILVLIDYPDFNIKLAHMAKSFGIKILYYVSPQVWAWRKGRIKKIATVVDRMAVILPFEENLYKRSGVSCEFVGHPILEEIENILNIEIENITDINSSSMKKRMTGLLNLSSELRTHCKKVLGLSPDRPLLSLLPGSRPHELNRLLPVMGEVVKEFKGDQELTGTMNWQFCVPLASNTEEAKYAHYLETLKYNGVLIKKGESIRVLTASDMAVVASGTATLQTAFLEVPMVVVYKLSPITYLIGRSIIDVKHISLVNILSGRGVVTELLQAKANPIDIVKELKKIMFDTECKENMLHYYRLIKEPFLDKKPSQRVAEIVTEMAGVNH